MAALCFMLFIIVDARSDKSSEIIFGGAEGAFIRTDDFSSVQAVSTNPKDTAEDDGKNWPEIDILDHKYTIVNDDNALSAVYYPEVEDIPSSYVTYACKFDSEAMPYLLAMIDAAREAGFSIYVNSAYISFSYQQQIFNGAASGVAEQMGITTDYLDPEYQLAVEKAKTYVRYPGTSEHQLGLAVDIVDRYYGSLKYSNMNQEMFAWLDEHCAEYGFIKRFPTKKLLLTGLDESWHYRYVGTEAAKFIMDNDICFEQFYAHYDSEFTY